MEVNKVLVVSRKRISTFLYGAFFALARVAHVASVALTARELPELGLSKLYGFELELLGLALALS